MARNTWQPRDRELAVRLTFVAKDPNSNPTNSPTLYRTDRGSWLVQGFVVTDAKRSARPAPLSVRFRGGVEDLDASP
ncbi:hypothetical protein AB0M36_34280 [Actinoplanes sp. NPDC051346]|uniref:hypothetical protein n=1 Tax=Actinoplanes sp. NPDC051346 TaxID=3155048 RepID=UPI00342E6FEB